jgi:hypothetical protein
MSLPQEEHFSSWAIGLLEFVPSLLVQQKFLALVTPNLFKLTPFFLSHRQRWSDTFRNLRPPRVHAGSSSAKRDE